MIAKSGPKQDNAPPLELVYCHDNTMAVLQRNPHLEKQRATQHCLVIVKFVRCQKHASDCCVEVTTQHYSHFRKYNIPQKLHQLPNNLDVSLSQSKNIEDKLPNSATNP
jgi:hypothetical protein